MLSISDIIKWANEKILPLLPGIKTYGVAKAAIKGEFFAPYTGEKYIGYDDTYPAQLYHKELSISSTIINRSGYGDSGPDLQNTYGMAMILNYNEKTSAIPADKIYTYIQSIITGSLKSDGYKSIRVNVSNAILNDGQVWVQEYGQTPFKLMGPQRLIQINYNIVMVFDKKCIEIPNCLN